MQDHLTRALLLLERGNLTAAEKEVREALNQDPGHPLALRILAVVQLDTQRVEEALDTARAALQADPSDALSHTLLANVHLRMGQLREAEERVQEATVLDPSSSQAFALWSAIALDGKQYARAEELANQALALDPENMQAINVRATAQRNQGNHRGALETLHQALEQAPEDSSSHANVGWSKLDQGEVKESLTHFGEALRLNPENPYAKAGLVEALKARYWFYRLFLNYYMWIGKKSGRFQVALIILIVVANRYLNHLLEAQPGLQPLIIPVFVLLIGFVFSTWVISPLFNLLLLLNPHGRYALSANDRTTARLTGIALLLALLAGTTYLLFWRQDGMLALAIHALIIMIPLSTWSYELRPRQMKWVKGLTLGIGFIGLVSVLICLAANVTINKVTLAFIYGIVGFQILINYFMIKPSFSLRGK